MVQGSPQASPAGRPSRVPQAQTAVQHWFTYPNIDPVAVHLGPLAIHWYGLSYLVGFIAVGAWMARPAGRRRLGLTFEGVQDFLVYALIGVLVGGRTFFVIADIVTKHDASLYFGDIPRSLINVVAVWNGGMGFFGGLIGVIIAITLFVRKYPWLTFGVLGDEVVVLLPIGIALTRIVNFINDELVGNLCVPDQPWCIKFPSAAGYRYPSQVFEAMLDIAVLPIVYVVYRRRPPDGVVAWTWFTCYGITRSLAEMWRQTDLQLGPLTGGQLLALPMIAIGSGLIVFALRRNRHVDAGRAAGKLGRPKDSLAV
ncbi:MAG: prolipoprotein diacylglyceryl transferase [Candidatus Eremiobacteraeota bacterium]|nr:prolipoprotein diacylglyceryl transferase [Candidatus Eremiobacteraeota bacterium]MBC5804321.1 prolipoprotein diacylglyceryl transferase [Candidatus Eremiobacteraeota bacterium]